MSDFIKTGNQVGRSIALFRLIMAILVASSLCSSGVALITRKPKYTSKIEGAYENVECQKKTDENGRRFYECNLEYSYEIDGTRYTGIHNSKQSSVELKTDESVTIHYDPTNIEDSTIDPIPGKKIGFGLISVGCCMITVSFIVYQITRKIKGAGTLVAGAAAYNFLTD